jgi:hypothetical protein
MFDYNVELNTNIDDNKNVLIINIKLINKETNILFLENNVSVDLNNNIIVNNFKNFIRDIRKNRDSYIVFPNIFLNVKFSFYNEFIIFKFSNELNSLLFKIEANNSIKSAFYSIDDLFSKKI